MDDFLGGLVGLVVAFYILVHVIAYIVVFAVGAGLLYLLFVYVIMPGCGWLAREAPKAAEALYQWYREVTWPYRMRRTREQTLAAMDQLRREQVKRVRMIAEEIDRYQVATGQESRQTRTTHRTAAVRPVVGSAVRHR